MQKKYPFKFLDAYTPEDSNFFFGRNDEIEELYEMVFQTDLILLYGASGTGKTSLIQCGLASKFQSHDWLALDIRRGSDLNASFEDALRKAAGGPNEEAMATSQPLTEDLEWLDEDWSDPGSVAAPSQRLSPLARRFKAIYLRHFKPLYLIFDQFEELYTIENNRDEQQQFIQTVKEILLVEQPVKIILSIREEYLGYLYEFERQVPELLRKKLRVEPMNLDKVKTVIQGVSSQKESNVRLQAGEESAIAEGIFAKIKGDGKTLTIELPYLQVLLDKLYLQITGDKDRKQDATLTLKGLKQIGDIGDVLRNFLDEQVLDIAAKRKQLPDTIWQTLSPFATTEGTKSPLTKAQLTDSLTDETSKALVNENILKDFEDSRILRFSEHDERYEVVHDSLAKQIAAKRSDEQIALLEVRQLIRNQVTIKKENRELFSRKQLGRIKQYKHKLQLTKDEENHVNRSRNALRLRTLMIIVLILALGFLVFWIKQRDINTKEEQAKTNAINRIIKKAEELKSIGDSYQDLGKGAKANETYRVALDSLGGNLPEYPGLKDSTIYIELEKLTK